MAGPRCLYPSGVGTLVLGPLGRSALRAEAPNSAPSPSETTSRSQPRGGPRDHTHPPQPGCRHTGADARHRRAGPAGLGVARWRQTGIGVLRIAFGVVWAIDAWFKWQPSFINQFSDYLTGAKDGQPQLLKDWIDFQIKIVKDRPPCVRPPARHRRDGRRRRADPGRLLPNLSYLVGGLLAAVGWSTAEGLGGSYKAGSTDIGAAIIYVIVFVGLFLSSAGLYLGFDGKLRTKLRRFRWATS